MTDWRTSYRLMVSRESASSCHLITNHCLVSNLVPTWYNCTNQPGYQPGTTVPTNLVPTTAWFPTWLSLKSASFDTAQNGNHQSNLFYAASFFLFLFTSIFLSVSSNDSGFESLFDDPTNVSTAHDDFLFLLKANIFLKLDGA